MQSKIYNEQFRGNVLIVGKTGDDDTVHGHLTSHQKYVYTSRLKHYFAIFMH